MSQLSRKYTVSKVDGSPVDPAARYFVLRYDRDPHARTVLARYADSVRRAGDAEFADALLCELDATEAAFLEAQDHGRDRSVPGPQGGP